MPSQVGVMPSKPPVKSSGGLMSKKIAGVPLPVIGVGLMLAVAVGLYLRSRASASGSAASSAAPAAADTGATGGGSASGDGSDPNAGLEDAIYALVGQLGAGTSDGSTGADFGSSGSGGSGGSTTTPASASQPTVLSGGASPTPLQQAETTIGQAPPGTDVRITSGGTVLVGQDAKSPTQSAANSGSMSTLQLLSHSIPASDNTFAADAVARSAALQAVGAAPAFGGVASTVTNKKTGVTTTTYASGRIVQQAPGKTAYVAHK